MKINAIEEYGLRVAIQLAREGAGGSLAIPEIAEREGLSTAYVGKLLAMLRQAGVVTSARGRSGGYALARAAEEISAAEVLRVFGGQVWDASHCERHAGTLEACVHLGRCSVRSLWGQLESLVDQLLRSVTLADLVAGRTPWRETGSRTEVVQSAVTAVGKEE
jgi:Rrf2 family protein